MSRWIKKPPTGTHWQYNDDPRFPCMELIDTRSGEVLGHFYTDIYSGRISFYFQSRVIVRKAWIKTDLRYPLNNQWDVKK